MEPDLFEASATEYYKKNAPLADRVRPEDLDAFFGQEEILGEGKFLSNAISSGNLPSVIFWGPPGTGKTTLARIIAGKCNKHFVSFSAVTSGKKDVKEVIEHAKELIKHKNIQTILFVDEIHRFNKLQQDAFLHSVEDGTLILIGATTENPSFEINSALLSRCQVVVFKSLSADELKKIIKNALESKSGLSDFGLTIDDDALTLLGNISFGDARAALNFLELSALKAKSEESDVISLKTVMGATNKASLLYDKTGEEHYNLISALHKSLRGSDADASLYWLCRMLEAGEDPKYVARRMFRFAYEDIGNADPQAILLANSAVNAVNFIGMPEAELSLAQLAIYLAAAPKSNSIYTAYKRVKAEVRKTGALPTPLHIRNAPTALMKELGYGSGYKYPHDYEGARVKEEYLPEGITNNNYYYVKEIGFEREIKKRLEYYKKVKDDA
jgi:putative ATPase